MANYRGWPTSRGLDLSLEPTLGLAQVIGLEEYAEEGSSDEEESSVDEKSLANKDISNEEILCAERERGIIRGQDAEERYDAEERIAGEPSKGIVDNETWFLEIFLLYTRLYPVCQMIRLD